MRNKFIIAITPAIVILIALMFAFMPAGESMHGITPEAATSSIQPNITLNTNLSWNTFYPTWSPLEYSNGTANLTLNTGLSTIYKNPISVNPTDIVAPGLLQNDNLSKAPAWENLSTWTELGGAWSTGTIGNSKTISITTTLANTNSTANGGYILIPITDYPSASPQYDFLTVAYSLSGPDTIGVNGAINLWNTTGGTTPLAITPGQTGYMSIPLSQTGLGFNTTTGAGCSEWIKIYPVISTPAGATSGSTWTLTISGMAFTDYAIPLGTNSTGVPIVKAINPTMAQFGSANLNYQAVLNDGYTVATSQPLQNESETQTPLSGTYEEQVEYAGKLGNITAPDLRTGPANITINQDIAQKQIQILEINGQSYTSDMNATGSNKTTLLMTANAGSAYTVIDITDYTTAQWGSISQAAGFFQNPRAWIEGGIFAVLIVVVSFLGFKGLGKTLKGEKANEESHARILNGKKGR